MHCLVTGGAGFIGSHLVDKLRTAGHEVSVLDRRAPLYDVPWINVDLRDGQAIDLRGFDVVYHLAAVANARRSSEQADWCYATNVQGTLNLVQAAARDQVQRVLLASTCWVAGAQCADAVNEDTPFDLRNINTVYGASKTSQELILFSHYQEFGAPSFTVLRYGVPYGERMWRGLVVRAFMEMAEAHGRIYVMGDGKQHRNFLYVGDLCDAQVLALDDVARNKVYNLTGDAPIRVQAIAEEVARHLPAQIEYIPQARVEPRLKNVANHLAKAELGWETKTSFSTGIARCVGWWRELSAEEKAAQYWL